jgi:hypothetical protein
MQVIGNILNHIKTMCRHSFIVSSKDFTTRAKPIPIPLIVFRTVTQCIYFFICDYNFENRTLIKGKAIPSQFDFLIMKVSNLLSLSPDDFAELLITEYPIDRLLIGTGMLLHLIKLREYLFSRIAFFAFVLRIQKCAKDLQLFLSH